MVITKLARKNTATTEPLSFLTETVNHTASSLLRGLLWFHTTDS